MLSNPIITNLVIPVIASLVATGIGVLIVWLWSRKKRDDESANRLTRIENAQRNMAEKHDNSYHNLSDKFDTLSEQITLWRQEANLFQRELLVEVRKIFNEAMEKQESLFNTALTEIKRIAEETAAENRRAIEESLEKRERIAREKEGGNPNHHDA